jgi:hypothetical protein
MIVKQRNDFDKFLDAYNAFKQYGIRDPLLETSHCKFPIRRDHEPRCFHIT